LPSSSLYSYFARHPPSISHFFLFNDPATSELYTLSLHDALPIYSQAKAHPLLFINDKEWNVTMDNHPHVEEAIGSLKMGEQFTRNVADHSLSERFQAMLFCQQGEETYYKNEFPAFNFVR